MIDISVEEPVARSGAFSAANTYEQVYPGVWRVRILQPEEVTPVSTRSFGADEDGLSSLPHVDVCPVRVEYRRTSRGIEVRHQLDDSESIYGLGLQLRNFRLNGRKVHLRVNADPQNDSGDSHAPVPFYASTGGYGVLVDTARYGTVYVGSAARRSEHSPRSMSGGASVGTDSLPVAYTRDSAIGSEVLTEVPHAGGVDVYIFAGPNIREAVQRYNLFAGGGAHPPRWGLGFWYRTATDFTQEDVTRQATELRARGIPCDVIGIEPGWQSAAYSCSYGWSDRFPHPERMVDDLAQLGMRVNLWEHGFVHRSATIHDELLPLSGDFRVWDGLVPDFVESRAQEVFASAHVPLVDAGIAGFKLDECDNSDFTGGWSFPELSSFPSGADGEQMHSLFGIRYQDATLKAFAASGEDTYGLTRNSHALAAPYPFVLYSDLYDHAEFIHAIAQSSFSGLLWAPEVRHATDSVDLIRRLQTAVFSPIAMVNAWYLAQPPWIHTDTTANLAGERAADAEEIEEVCRQLIRLRMRFVPYLDAAFADYRRTGLPPFRALVLDHPDDIETHTISDEFMVGADILVAPMTAQQTERSVYLPHGRWRDFWTGELLTGGTRLVVSPSISQIPVFVKDGAVIPLAVAVMSTDEIDEIEWVHFGDAPPR
ncbi:TIM-barrel domain-containing protein [Microbacterium murale]|uniref:Glycosyl hydrolase family 31 n=1 Tax=Microbacterium murale TaxID=1081040 RepID=A0ABQ1S0L0_9MICO|nr:TIM-barrel domain-containing protein [Microbacterium murale]GGD86264.1 glycosyl hydrolase family 31 [Microbacterium murale]